MGKIYGDRWEIVKQLDEGGQAHTFLVKDLKGETEIQYVLKRLKNPNRIERFKREIEVVRNLFHPNIVRLVDFDLTIGKDNKPYLVTEYCSEGSLAKSKPFWNESPIKALELFRQICEGVAYAHSHDPSIIHRDLKPDNILLRAADGPAVVADFGICYFEEDGTRITITEEAVGAKDYMAPELEDGRLEDVSRKSDTYSLGKILYWLLSGRIFSREKHRDLNWDLKGKKKWSGRNPQEEFWDNIYMEHINRLLDRMIVHDPQDRLEVSQVLNYIQGVKRIIRKEFNPIGQGIQQPCIYCGYGHYQVSGTRPVQVRNFFGTNVSGEWRLLTCDICGHVQFFRLENARRKDWWD